MTEHKHQRLPQSDCRARKPTRLLLIEDHELLAEVTAELLKAKGVVVRTAFTGRSALEIAERFDPDIIICDIRLPDMSGFDVIRAVQATSLSRVFFAVCSAMDESDVRAFQKECG